MIFTHLLYIFQSEHYDRIRFLRFVYKNISSWNSFSKRGSIDWTLRAKIIMFLSVSLLFLDILAAFLLIDTLWVRIVVILIQIFCIPLYIIFADIFISPLLYYAKKRVLEKAKKIILNTKNTQRKNIREGASLQVIGITGSFGKTSLKNILGSLLTTSFRVMTVPGNINTDLGVSNYLIANAEALKNIDFLLVEMGAYTRGDIASVCSIVEPEYSFLTAISPVHFERFGSLANIIRAKFELPEHTSKITFLNGKEENITKNLHRLSLQKGTEKVLCNGRDIFSEISFLPEFSGISFEYQNNEKATTTFRTPLIALHILDLFGMVLPFAEKISISPENIQKGISNLSSIPHRLEVLKNTKTGVTVIDDSYNGNYSGFVSGIETLSRAKGRKVVLTPGIVELGSLQQEVHEKLAHLYISSLDMLLLIKNSNTTIIENIVRIHNQEAEKNNKKILPYIVYKNVHKAHADLPNVLNKGDTILFQNDLSDNYS